MPGPKKSRNAKEGGAIPLSKRRHSEHTDVIDKSPPSAEPSTSVLYDPTSRATAIPTNRTTPSIASPSPVLDALSTTSVSTGTAPSVVPDWTQNPLSSSPANYQQFPTDSPPTLPSSYEDSARISPPWPQRQAAYSTSVSPSPIRPSSYQVDPTHYMGNEYLAGQLRRGSTVSQYASPQMSLTPNSGLAPQSQPYYYGPPDIDIDPAQSGLHAGDRGYQLGFDTFPRRTTEGTSSFGTDTAVLTGYEGGLKVYALTKHTLEPSYNLSGLHGGVIAAKILPWVMSGDQGKFPLVVVIVHGPMVPEKPTAKSAFTSSANARDGATADGSLNKVEYYQTSVEVYSLRTNERVDVLLRLPPTPISPTIPITSQAFEPPSPSGLLTLRADAGYITVSSGSSGEVWVFSHIPHAQPSESQFGCLAKLWTSVQQRLRADAVDDGNKMQTHPPAVRVNTLQPIFALNGRWLAYCPPKPSGQLSIKAEITVPMLGKAPGVLQPTPFQVPMAFTAVDQPLAGSFMNKLMRETTQELIHGAKWVGQQGISVLQSYWSKPNSAATMARSPPSHTWASSYPPKVGGDFPPTHGASTSVSTKEPGTVCLVDLESLGNMANIHPFATFSLVGGCSYLSFSPTGLFLFTASAKGDVQMVWDLMRTQHTKSSLIQMPTSPANSGTSGVHVRQIAQFSRLTEARIIDVSWTKPNGEQIAMVTERGTVHLLDMPYRAFSWPPPRRRGEGRHSPTASGEGTGNSAVSLASNAIGAALVAARPLMARPRRSSTTAQIASGSSHLVESASHGGRIIAASISNSIGKTGHAISQLRQNAENRVTIPSTSSTRPPLPGCVTWVKRKHHNTLYVATNGLVRAFPSKSRRMSTSMVTNSGSSSAQGRYSRDHMAYRDLAIPTLPDNVISDYIRNLISGEDELVMSDHEMEAGSALLSTNRHVSAADRSVAQPTTEATIPEAEIESSAPYQPFHTDRRISLYEYRGSGKSGVAAARKASMTSLTTAFAEANFEDMPHDRPRRKKRTTTAPDQSDSAPTVKPAQSANTGGVWAFGQPLATTKLNLGFPEGLDEDMMASLEDHRALPASAMERRMQQIGHDEQILITTRRRRRVVNDMGGSEDDGFFEDDCEVLDFADQRV
ncbi:hypothetical protein BROUX41_002477 [Berkeleyomyces rouxiae]